MRKTDGIILGIALVIIGLIILTVKYAEGEVFQVLEVSGGLNVAVDSTALKANEAMVMDNLVLDPAGFPKARQGYSYWDSIAIDTSEEIDEIYVYEPYSGTKRMVIATNGGVYIAPSIARMGAVDWDTLKMGWDGDNLRVTNTSTTIYDWGTRDWWYSKLGFTSTGAGDTITINSVKYKINAVYNTPDTVGGLGVSYAGITDTVASYRVVKTTLGNVYFIQSGDKLYICDSEQPMLVYDDTSYVFAALIDSGTVSDTTELVDSTYYNKGKMHHGTNNPSIFIPDSLAETVCDSDWVGYNFTLFYDAYIDGNIHYGLKSTQIIRDMYKYTTGAWTIYLEGNIGRTPIGYWNNYQVSFPATRCMNDSGWAISDSGKNWNDDVYGFEYLQNFFAINADAGYDENRRIFCNEDSSFSIEWGDSMTYKIGEHYYIFAGSPYIFPAVDSSYKEYPRFEQVFFYNNQLYGFGYDRNWTLYVTNTNKNRIWYSAFGESRDQGIMHRYIKPDYNIDVDASEDISVMFGGRGRDYIATENSIWTFSRSGLTNDFYKEKVISNQGIPDIDNWAKATEEYGYFTNRFGVYRFDGVRPEKISWNIDPLLRDNYGSRIVMVYQDYNLYVSFPDSDFTLVYDERFGRFTSKLSFGMTCAYAPPDTNIIYFGHSNHKGQIFYYPNDKYYNDLGTGTETYATAYESGWMADGGYWTNKRFSTIYWPINGTAQSVGKFYVDFDTIACDTVIFDSTGIFVYRKDLDKDCVGEYHKMRIEGGADSACVFGGYRILWDEIQPSIK